MVFSPLTFLRLVRGPGRAAGSAGRYGDGGAVTGSGLVRPLLRAARRRLRAGSSIRARGTSLRGGAG